jgi:hypothetical protein
MAEFKYGRKRPIARPLRFGLNNYLKKSLPPAPAECKDLVLPARDSLSRVYLNDKLSCCTAAAAFHVEYVMLAAAGVVAVGDDNDVLRFYSGSTGYIPGKPETDLGGDEQTVLNYWREHGLVQGRRKIAGHIFVNAQHIEEMKSAIWLFENLYFGIEMPRAWTHPRQPQESGFIWDVAGEPDYSQGHAFPAIGYDERGVYISTWGMVGLMTWRAASYYATRGAGGEVHTILSPDSLIRATKRTPHGFDWSQLVADFDSAGGNVRGVLADNE